MRTDRYPTDLTDKEWMIVAPLFSKSEKRGRILRYDLRRILDGCFYVLRGGISWRMMPHDLPPWRVVYDHFSRWRRTGHWERVNHALRERHRVAHGRAPLPTAAVVDSQAIKTTGMGGPRGYDGGKKIKGRKRQTLVDTEGTVLKVKVHPADVHDKVGGALLLQDLHLWFPTILLVWADTHYQGLRSWAKETMGWTIEVAKHWWTNLSRRRLLYGGDMPDIPRGFHILPRRWVVERTFAWLVTNRRLASDWERLPETGEAFIYMAMSRTLIKRLARGSENLLISSDVQLDSL